jgi:CBS domain-containing protein
MTSVHIPVDQAGPHVRDVMLASPRALPADATVADARAAFANPKERLLLVCDGERFVAGITRADIEGADDGAPVTSVAAAATPTLAPEDDVAAALEIVGDAVERVPVVDGDGALRGLVCFNPRGSYFCA